MLVFFFFVLSTHIFKARKQSKKGEHDMKRYKITYVGIGGILRYTTIEAYTPYEAREEFTKSYWTCHEILSIEPM